MAKTEPHQTESTRDGGETCGQVISPFSLRSLGQAILRIMRKNLALGLLAAATFGTAALAAVPPASVWEIGPHIRGKNYSVGMPLRPQETRQGWAFDFPHASRAAGHVHYVTFRPGPLTGKSRIKVRYRVTAERGTRFVPQEQPDEPATVSLFLQRNGDNWTAKGRYDFYRWYAPPETVQRISPGVHEITVDLDDPEWISVAFRPASENPSGFRAALRDTDRIGLVFGSSSLRGHGVYATAPARFELLSFELE